MADLLHGVHISLPGGAGSQVPGPKMANMLEHGATPVLPPASLHAMGYKIVAHPVTLLSAAVRAMQVGGHACHFSGCKVAFAVGSARTGHSRLRLQTHTSANVCSFATHVSPCLKAWLQRWPSGLA